MELRWGLMCDEELSGDGGGCVRNKNVSWDFVRKPTYIVFYYDATSFWTFSIQYIYISTSDEYLRTAIKNLHSVCIGYKGIEFMICGDNGKENPFVH